MGHAQHDGLTALLPRLYAFARTTVGNAEAARDLVQEAATRRRRRACPPTPGLPRLDVPHRPQCRVRRAPPQATARSGRFCRQDLWRFDDARIAKITVQQGLASRSGHREIISLIDIAGFSYWEVAEISVFRLEP